MSQSNLSSLAYDQLLRSIISFDLVPGTPLQERTIAEQLEMSRTPVREALRRLTFEGWVQNSFKRHVMEVKPVSEDDVEELFEIRELFELRGIERIFAAKVCTQVGSGLQRLAECLKAFGTSQNFDDVAYLSMDMKLHTEVMYFASCSRLHRFWTQISPEFIRLGSMTLKSRSGGRASVYEEHEAIVRGLLSRRKKAACEAVHYHNEQTKGYIFQALDGVLQGKVMVHAVS